MKSVTVVSLVDVCAQIVFCTYRAQDTHHYSPRKIYGFRRCRRDDKYEVEG